MDRGPGQGHRAKDAAADAPFQRAKWGLSEPNPLAPGPAPNLGRFPLPFPHAIQGDREKKEKNLQERLYNGSQPASQIAQPMSTRSQRARAGSRVLQPSVTTQRGMGNLHLPPVQVPHTLFQALGLAEQHKPSAHPPTQGFPYFLTGSYCFYRPVPPRARLVCSHC